MHLPAHIRHTLRDADMAAQGYELTEEETNISLDDFRIQCGDANGAPKCVQMFLL